MKIEHKLLAAVHSLIAGTVFFCCASTVHAIRYELIDSAGGEQSGHTLEGFVEFDSPCGASCSVANITDFTFSVSGPTNYSYSYESAADVVMSLGSQFVNAGPTTLSINYARPGSLGLGKAPDGPAIQWSSSLSIRYVSYGQGFTGGWQSGSEKPPIVTTIGIVIPEPSTVSTMLLGCLSFLTFATATRTIL